MKTPTAIKKVEFNIKNLPPMQFLIPVGFNGEFYQMFKEELIPAVCNFFQKLEEENFPIHFMKIINVTLIIKPDT